MVKLVRLIKLLTCDILNGPLQLKLPISDILNSLSQFVSDVGLSSVGLFGGAGDQLLGLFANPALDYMITL